MYHLAQVRPIPGHDTAHEGISEGVTHQADSRGTVRAAVPFAHV